MATMQDVLVLLKQLSELLTRLGLPENQSRVLSALIVLGPLTQDALASILGSSISTVSEILKTLEAKGLIKKVGKVGRKNLYSPTKNVIVLVREYLDVLVRDLLELTRRLEHSKQLYRLKCEVDHVITVLMRAIHELSSGSWSGYVP